MVPIRAKKKQTKSGNYPPTLSTDDLSDCDLAVLVLIDGEVDGHTLELNKRLVVGLHDVPTGLAAKLPVLVQLLDALSQTITGNQVESDSMLLADLEQLFEDVLKVRLGQLVEPPIAFLLPKLHLIDEQTSVGGGHPDGHDVLAAVGDDKSQLAVDPGARDSTCDRVHSPAGVFTPAAHVAKVVTVVDVDLKARQAQLKTHKDLVKVHHLLPGKTRPGLTIGRVPVPGAESQLVHVHVIGMLVHFIEQSATVAALVRQPGDFRKAEEARQLPDVQLVTIVFEPPGQDRSIG